MILKYGNEILHVNIERQGNEAKWVTVKWVSLKKEWAQFPIFLVGKSQALRNLKEKDVSK